MDSSSSFYPDDTFTTSKIMENQIINQYRQEAEQRLIIDCNIDGIDHQHEANRLLLPYTEGWVSPPEMYAKIRHLMKVLEIAEASVKDTVADHMAANYGKQSLTIHGLVIKAKTGANRATYPNNPLIEEAAKRLSALQDIAKTLQKSGIKEVADTETGELIYPAVSMPSKDTIEVKFI